MVFNPIVASAEEPVVTDQLSAIKSQLQNMLTNASDAVITPTPISGVYQIQVGMTVVYMSQDGQYLLNGSLVELKSLENLTEKAKAGTRKEMMAAVPASSMIIYPAKGGEEHFLTVFTDIDCAFCGKLHKEIPALNKAGITVRYISYPRTGLGSPSYHKAVSVWCAKYPAEEMNRAMRREKIEKRNCVNPVKDHLMYARRFEVNGTPNIVLDNGEMLPGYVPAKELIKIFKQ